MLRNIFNNSIKLSVTLTSFWLGTASYSIIHRELQNKKLVNSYITVKGITISGIVGSLIGLYTYSMIGISTPALDKSNISNIKIIIDYNI